ncbi:MAG TPA: serine protease [Mycobacteriales bacterium]|nr:serine protease [Mycobacteriales bacterium]
MRNYRSRHREGLIAATVRVVTRTANGVQHRSGTGFFVAPGQVVTCAHVVPQVPGGSYAVAYDGTEHPAEVHVREPANAEEKVYSYPDVALLAVPVADHPSVPLGGEALPENGRELFAYGCPLLADGPFWDHMTMTSEGERAGSPDPAHRFVKTSRGQVRGGASGAGVIDVSAGPLVGMLKASRDPRQDLGAVLVPTATIVATLARQGYDVATANAAATRAADTVTAARRRLGRLLDAVAAELEPVAERVVRTTWP